VAHVPGLSEVPEKKGGGGKRRREKDEEKENADLQIQAH
jgi:hypothetical protein